MNVDKHYSELPPWAKGTLAVAGVASIIFIGVFVYKKISSFASNIGNNIDANTSVDEVDAAIKALSKTQKQNYQDSTYQSWANSIYTLLDGCDFGKNEYAVGQIIANIKNDMDWLKLVKAFGKKTIENCGLGSGNYIGDLPTVLNKELLTLTTRQINSFWTKQGMTSRI